MPTSRRTIVVPEQFPHVGFTSPRSFSDDPRKPKQVATDIDMRACEFIGPAAVVWCAVYALLAKHKDACSAQEDAAMAGLRQAWFRWFVLHD